MRIEYFKLRLTSNLRFLESDDFDGHGFLHTQDGQKHVILYTHSQLAEALDRFNQGYKCCNLAIPSLEVLGYNDIHQEVFQGNPIVALEGCLSCQL